MLYKSKRLFVLLFALILFLPACSSDEERDKPSNSQSESEIETGDSAKDNAEETAPDKNTEKETANENDDESDKKGITLSAIGDILIHDRVYEDARTQSGFDFMPMLEDVKPFLEESTITFANQESMIGGETIGLSSYPSFNSPQEIGDVLKQSGVDIVSIANNHTLDRGEEAVQNAIDHWKSINMMYVGAYQNAKDQQDLRIMETDAGISVAFLAYTYGTNGISVPAGKDYLVNLIDYNHMAEEIERATQAADAVVLSLHFGTEYERMPNDEQKDLVQFAADQGADIVLGHHPHVLQPMEWVEGQNGHEALAIYSLGNFLSGQDGLYRQIGGMAQMTISQSDEDDDSVEVHDPKFLPTFVKKDYESNYKVIPMQQASPDELSNTQKHIQAIKDHMSQWMPDLEFVEK